MRDMWENLGISAGVGALQIGAQAFPTAIDKQNEKRIKALERLQAKGKLGLSGAERQQMETELLAPARALSAEDRARNEAMMASMGDTSAATQGQLRRESEGKTQTQMMMAGATISKANLDMAAQQLQEYESRLMHKAKKQQAILGTIAKTASGVGEHVATARASKAVAQLDPAEFYRNNPDATPEDLIALVKMAARSEKQREAMAWSLLLGGLNPS